jgi:hypothetical protein
MVAFWTDIIFAILMGPTFGNFTMTLAYQGSTNTQVVFLSVTIVYALFDCFAADPCDPGRAVAVMDVSHSAALIYFIRGFLLSRWPYHGGARLDLGMEWTESS